MSQLLTSKELAEKADVDPRKLRRILRKEFKGAGKTSVEGKREEYRFNPDDPIVQQIIDRIQGQPAEKPKPEKPKAQKAKAIQPKGKKPEFGKPDPSTGGVPVDLHRMGTPTDVKQSETGA